MTQGSGTLGGTPPSTRKGPLMVIVISAVLMIGLGVANLRTPEPRERGRQEQTPDLVEAERLRLEAERELRRLRKELQELEAAKAASASKVGPPGPAPQQPSPSRPSVWKPPRVWMEAGILPGTHLSAARVRRARLDLGSERTTAAPPFLPAGSLLEARWLGPVTSDSGGSGTWVRAQVVRGVADASGRAVAVPAGSIAFGQVDEPVSTGKDRLGVSWKMIQRPDGEIIPLTRAIALGPDGAAGVPGDVNHHWGRLWASALAAGVSGGLLRAGEARDGELTVGDSIISGWTRSTSESVDRLVERSLDIPSSIEIPAASRVGILTLAPVLLP